MSNSLTGEMLLTNINLWSKRIEDPENIPGKYLKEMRMEKHGIKR